MMYVFKYQQLRAMVAKVLLSANNFGKPGNYIPLCYQLCPNISTKDTLVCFLYAVVTLSSKCCRICMYVAFCIYIWFCLCIINPLLLIWGLWYLDSSPTIMLMLKWKIIPLALYFINHTYGRKLGK